MQPAAASIRVCVLCGGAEARAELERGGLRYLLCERCGFVYVDLTEAEWSRLNEQAFEDALAGYAARSFAPAKQRRYKKRLAQLEPYKRGPAGRPRLVELGAGVGGFLAAARAAGWDAVGVEPVAACARHAREAHGLDVRACTLEEAGFAPGSFDAAYANAVLEHLYDPPRTLAALARALRPGGALFVDTVNHASYTRERVGAGWKLYDPARHACLYTPGTLRRLLAGAGLDVLRVRSHRVRLRPNDAPRPRGPARALEELRKLPLSLAARWTLKGESLAVLARKPRV